MKESVNVPKSIKDVKDHYSKATGIPCMILDLQNKSIVEGECDILDPICRYYDPLWKTHCLETHLHSAMLSERFGGSYIYFCLISMLYWVSPVIVNGKMDYAIIAGPVLTLEPSELLDEEFLQDADNKDELYEILKLIPHIEVSIIHNLSEVLRMCSGWASGYSEHRMVDLRASLELQSRLSESIQELKTHATDRFHCYPIEKEKLLQEAIQWGDKAKAVSILNELLGIIFFSSGSSLEIISFRIMEIISLLSRAAVKGGACEEIVFKKSLRCHKEIKQYNSLIALSSWLSKTLHFYLDLVIVSMEKEWDPLIAKALRYIHAHYKEPITLEESAMSVSLSPNYFSHLFNSKMGTSFSTYINRLRVDYASQLLIETSYPIIEIAGMAGFEEQSYFSKIFKDITSLSPGKYRKRGKAFPSENHEIHN